MRPNEKLVFTLLHWYGIVVLLACLGCGGSARRVNLEGSVTLDGKPVEQGIIRFVCQAGGSVNVVTIVNGKYDTADIKNRPGLLPGTHRVEFQVFERIESDEKLLLPDNVKPQKLVLLDQDENDPERTIVVPPDETPQIDFELHSARANVSRSRR